MFCFPLNQRIIYIIFLPFTNLAVRETVHWTGEKIVMILKSGAMLAACRPFVVRPNCFASNINTEQLRTKLDQLHAEAETARAKGDHLNSLFIFQFHSNFD